MLFNLGTIVHTPGFAALAGKNIEPTMYKLIQRHAKGDWGNLVDEDKQMNDDAIIPGQESRILSRYDVNGESVYVITEWDRSVTTFLLPSEY